MRFKSLFSTGAAFALAILATTSMTVGCPRGVAAEATNTANNCGADKGFRSGKVDASDPVRQIKISTSQACCGRSAKKPAKAVEAAPCVANVDVQYCHTQIINNVPISFCYWNRLKEYGTYHADRNCCEVTLRDVNGRTYCVPVGTTLVIGPIVFGMQAKTSEVAPPPPLVTVESIEGGRTVIRVIPQPNPDGDGKEVFVYEGNRLFVIEAGEPPALPGNTSQSDSAENSGQ